MSQLAYSTSGVSVVTTQHVYPGIGSFSISSSGKYGFNESLSLTNNAVSTLEAGSSITLTGTYNYTPSPGIIYLYSFTQILKPTITTTMTTMTTTGMIMNLLGGQSNWYKPHIYVGENTFKPTNQWPIFYSSSTANANYWALASATLSVANPILELVPNGDKNSGGAMFWNSTYTSGQSITISMIGTYTQSSTQPAAGFEIYLFIPPGNGWEISSSANYSTTLQFISASVLFIGSAASTGAVILPEAGNGKYLVIQWNPYYVAEKEPNEFNIYVVDVSGGEVTNGSRIGPVGSGIFSPSPGDMICFIVTYNAATNTVTAIVRDLNTGQVAALLNYNLNGYFSPPKSGLYLFGVGAATGGSTANWGALYVSQG
ncbi:MAG: hypothetical protein TU36_003620 [Vulcanisaeta sp. AZ3]|jgi:hypothetical protein